MYQKVLVPLDGSELAEAVIPHAEAIGRGCDVEIVLVRVVEPLDHLFRGAESRISPEQRKRVETESIASSREYLESWKTRLENSQVKVRTDVLTGPVAETLVDYAEKGDFGLIIIASHGRSGPSRWVWGSVADRILHAACTPVFMVRPPGCEPRQRKRPAT